MKYITIILFALFSFFSKISASGIKITNCVYQDKHFNTDSARITATLTVSWKNAWKNDKNHDAAWIFFKIKNDHERRSERHGLLIKGSVKIIHEYNNISSQSNYWMPDDLTGFFIYPGKTFRGDVNLRVQVEIDVSKVNNLPIEGLKFVSAHAIEMVYIPKGAFYLGDVDTFNQKYSAAFFEYGTGKPYQVTSEGVVKLGTEKGNLFFHNNADAEYKGEAKGIIPVEFPKGYQAFYCMKYELTEGQYVSFLNSISYYYTTNRANFGGRYYYDQRGGIYFKQGEYLCDSPHRPASFLSFEDQAAFADWSALRPMTELEYEKACRGTNLPRANEFPWGSVSRDKLSRYFNDEGDLVYDNNIDEKDLTDNNLELYGASFYWVMDLNKGLWERCISIGNENGRNFKGSHGDGDLIGYYGTASNEDWPKGMSPGSGIGYRGGGSYELNMVGSPEGRVAQREFAAWGDGPRDIAYGFRAVRTAGQ